MPDRTTSSDIEDVLGSIRRLVSEEASARPKAPRGSDRLVLTPDYRVGEPEGPADAPFKLGEPVAGAAASTSPSIAEELAELEAKMSRNAERWKDEEPQPTAEDPAPATGEDPEAEAAEPAQAAGEPVPEAEESVAATQDRPLEGSDPAPAAEEQTDVAEDEAEKALESALEDQESAPEVEEEPSPEAAAGVQAEAESAPAADEPATDFDEPASEAAESAGGIEDPEPEAEELSAEAEEPATWAEEEVSNTFDAWEPAGEDGRPGFRRVEAGASGAETMLEEPPIEADIVRLATAAPLPNLPDNVGKPDVESLLDEAELRALVAEVLREELKGPLGERITRNVRKLVRREIAQALSSMEID
ncbi:MAG: hypothetical protein OEM24_06445 [Paracoccaceae bacterium]|nr:hypothetical protein [Paracoccaceae bacterium]